MAMKKAQGKKGSSGPNSDAEIFKFEEKGDQLEGTLVEKGELTIDDRDVPRYVIKTGDGGTYSTLGSFRLSELMAEVPVGSKVRIEYTGKKRLKGGKTLKEFDVEYDDTGATATTAA